MKSLLNLRLSNHIYEAMRFGDLSAFIYQDLAFSLSLSPLSLSLSRFFSASDVGITLVFCFFGKQFIFPFPFSMGKFHKTIFTIHLHK